MMLYQYTVISYAGRNWGTYTAGVFSQFDLPHPGELAIPLAIPLSPLVRP